jgi:dTMP kinase
MPIIAFEGVDRSGKSTQIRLLNSFLIAEGFTTKVYHLPDRTCKKTGKILNDLLTKKLTMSPHESFNLFHENRELLQQEILNNKTDFTLLDRWWPSGVAYTSALLDKEYDNGVKKSKELFVPDMTIYLQVDDFEQIGKRQGFGLEIYENKNFLRKVQKYYDIIFPEIPHVITLNANIPISTLKLYIQDLFIHTYL